MFRFITLAVCALWSSSTAAQTIRYFPVSAHTAGQFDTVWVTDARIFNPDPLQPITVGVGYMITTPGVVPPVPVEIAPLTAAHLDDILGQFLQTHGTAGIMLQSDSPFFASSRTYTIDDGGGSYGQYVAAVGSEHMTVQGFLLSLRNQPEQPGFRTNIGFLKPETGFSESVTLRVLDLDTSEELGAVTWELPWFGQSQLNDVFNAIGRGDEAHANAGVAFTATCPVFAYASVVDNLTGDAIFVTPVGIEAGPPLDAR